MKYLKQLGVITLLVGVAMLLLAALSYWRDPYESYGRLILFAVIALTVGVLLLVCKK